MPRVIGICAVVPVGFVKIEAVPDSRINVDIVLVLTSCDELPESDGIDRRCASIISTLENQGWRKRTRFRDRGLELVTGEAVVINNGVDEVWIENRFDQRE